MGSKSVKCKVCNKKYVSKQALIDHIERQHQDSIPEGWNAARYENYLRTGKTEGRCVQCGKPTGWNDATGKYNRMCGSEACKKKAREAANKNYIGVHGKPYSINDPEQQKKMVYSRKNSGKYIFKDEDTGKEYVAMYDSSYGKDFFEMLDTFLNWDGSDIIAPSPHTYWYEYDGKKHFYIPDAYSTSLNLEIELKDGGDNPNMHPKIQAVDKVKEAKKDAVMKSLKGQVNYIKICNKDYSEFFALLSELKDRDTCPLPKWESKLEPLHEAVMDSTYEDDEILEARLPKKPMLHKRYKLLADPMLNYDNLLDYYRKRLFHDKLNQKEWDALYNELLHVRDYLKKVVNTNSGNYDERMEFEAKKALKEVENFISYMEEKNATKTPINESTYIEATKNDTKYYPIFIFLSYTGTNMAKLIKSYTKDPYSHSSLSFDTELTNMVSFNRGGMVDENIKEGIWKERGNTIKYSLYMYLASGEEYDAMRGFVNELLGKRSSLKYNVLGLTNFIFGRGSDREDKFFCSEFVAATITAGNKNVMKTKPYMTSPYMLAKNKNFKFIKRGIIKNYNAKAVDNIVKDILEEGGYTDVIIK